MQALVAGSTGLVGRRLVDELTDRGHDVVGLTRDEAGDHEVEERSGEPRRGDLFDADSLVEAARGCDVVVRVATDVPTGTNPDAEDWERNDRLRREGTRNLLAAARAVDADRFLQESVVWVARQPDGSTFDEDSEPNPHRATRSALDAERIAADEVPPGLDACTLRLGWLYGHDAVQTRLLAENLLAGDLPVIGGGLLGRRDAKLSLLHADDAGRAFALAAESDATGVYHVVDEEPATAADFMEAMADRLDAPSPRRIPWWIARPLAGKDLVNFMTSPMPTTAERFRRETGFEPEVPTYREGLDRVVETWLRTGALRETPDGFEWVGEADPADDPEAVPA